MNKLFKVLIVLFFISVAINIYPKFWKDQSHIIYDVIDLLPLRILLLAYLVKFYKTINWYFLIGLLLVIISEHVGKYNHYVGSLQVFLNGLSYLFYIAALRIQFAKIPFNSIVLFSIPFLIMSTGFYIYLFDAIVFMGNLAVAFYIFGLGIFMIITLSIVYNNYNSVNRNLLLSLIFSVITAIVNAINVMEFSFYIEAVLNVSYICSQYFMFKYVTATVCNNETELPLNFNSK